jgi:GH35 family endo-1,4-beta-xylanase
MSNRKKILDRVEAQKEMVDKRVNDGIEKYRKGDMEITLVDNNGKPIPNAKVSICQKTHEFKFGANLFMLNQFETAEKNQKYKECFCELFNMATLPFYWNATEPEKGKLRYTKDSEYIYRRPPIDACLDFCFLNGIEPREHGLAYELTFPAWLYNQPVDVIKRELERRYSEISKRYADKIPTIEVTNEMCWWDGKTAFYNQPDYVEWCFKLAQKYFPNNQLVINEYAGEAWERAPRTTTAYYAYTENALLKGARIDAIGLQYHLFFTRENEYAKSRAMLDPENLFAKMDMYSNLNKPLQITEVTVPSYSWEKEDEDIQAEVIEKLYSVWFSHPNMEQIIYWNLVDGYAHVNSTDTEVIKNSQGNMSIGENYYHGGLLRFDLTPKPAFYKIKNLIQKIWHTEQNCQTNQNGKVAIRGFFGNYDLLINVNGKTIKKEFFHSKKTDGKFTIKI